MEFKKHVKNIFSDSIIYGIGTIISRFISIFLLPLYTNEFSPKDYAILSLVSVSLAVVSLISTFAIENAVALYYHKSESEEEKYGYFSTWFFFEQTTALICGLGFLLFYNQFNNFIGKGFSNFQHLPFICFAVINLGVLQRVTLTWLRSNRKLWWYTGFTLVSAILMIFLNYLFVIVYKMGIIGIFYGQVMSLCFSVIVGFFLTYKVILFKYFSLIKLKQMFKFSTPLIPSAFFSFLLSSVGTYFLESDRNQLGLYQFGSSLSSLAAIPIMAFNQSYPNYAFSISKSENAKTTFRLVLNGYFIIFGVYVLLIGFFMPSLIGLLANEKYTGAYIPAFTMAVYHFVAGGWQVGALGLNFAENNRPVANAIFIGGSINFLLLFLLRNDSNAINVALSMTISQFIILIYICYSSEKVYPLGVKLYTLFLPVMTLLLSVYLFWKYNA